MIITDDTIDRLKNWRNIFADELENNILNCWLRYAADKKYGGFYGFIHNNNKADEQTPKGLVMHGRFLWTYSAAYRINRYLPYFHAAERTLFFLEEHLMDKERGGYYWICDYTGKPIDKKKQIYGQAFAIYGLSEFARASGLKGPADQAKQVFRLLEEKARDPQYGGYFEAFERDWSFPADGKSALGNEDPDCEKSMNTNLHVLEAYTNLYRVCPEKPIREALEDLVNVIFKRIVDPNTHHLNLFFDKAWNSSLKIESYGHDVEAGRLLWEALTELKDQELQDRYKAEVIAITDTTINEGLSADFGLNYQKKDNILETDKHWWPQAELMIGLLNAWQMTGDQSYLEIIPKTWDFVKKNIAAENGEWYWGRKADNTIMKDEKGGIWKTPYHNGRFCMEFIERIDKIMQARDSE